MAELRQDIVTGCWVAVATERALRPTDFRKPVVSTAPSMDPAECPFCPGNERSTPLEVLAVRPEGSEPDTPGWQVRVFPNKYPAFESCEVCEPGTKLFPRQSAEGSHEVIVHSPDHEASLATMAVEEVELVLRVYRHRYDANCADPQIAYVQLILNHGRESGASLEHSHSQLFGVPLVPPLIRQELEGAERFERENGSCVFCSIIEAELEAGARVIASNETFVVIAPFASMFPFEVWILPREHQPSYGMIRDEQLGGFAEMVRFVLGRYREEFDDPPINYFIHSAPCGGGEYPFFHWHMEVVPRLTNLGSFELGTHMTINIVTPETATLTLGTDTLS
jgi:UDPglucose--hexose-1-phosphate uridylyltransferase